MARRSVYCQVIFCSKLDGLAVQVFDGAKGAGNVYMLNWHDLEKLCRTKGKKYSLGQMGKIASNAMHNLMEMED